MESKRDNEIEKQINRGFYAFMGCLSSSATSATATVGMAMFDADPKYVFAAGVVTVLSGIGTFLSGFHYFDSVLEKTAGNMTIAHEYYYRIGI